MIEDAFSLFQAHLKNNIPLSSDRSILKGKVLVFAPHPDDETLGCGGAITLHRARGDGVKIIVVTDGSKGYKECETRDYVALRKQESQTAFSVLGVEDYEFLDFEDQGFDISEMTYKIFMNKIKEFQADVIYCPSLKEIHRDHVMTAAVVMACLKSLGRPIQTLEYEISNPVDANILVDITSVIETKKSALSCYKSQLKDNDIATKCLALNAYRAINIDDSAIRYIEAFRLTTNGNRP